MSDAIPKTKFQESWGYRSIMVAPTIQNASDGFIVFRYRRRSPEEKSQPE